MRKYLFSLLLLIYHPTVAQPFDPAFAAAGLEQLGQKPHPKLIFTSEAEARLRAALGQGDAEAKAFYAAIKAFADGLMSQPVLRRAMTGKRLLPVSREAIKRTLTLAMTFRLEQDRRYLRRLVRELEALCAFSDWNPAHFLDVAEMATAIALAYDWTADELPPKLRQSIRKALADKALRPGLADLPHNHWVDKTNNWNLVCHGGLSVAALVLGAEEPILANAVLQRARQKLPKGFLPFAPDGIYPEGPSYWFYAASYAALTLSSFQTALGTDFGLSQSPGFLSSALFTQMCAGPSGQFFDYGDASASGFHGFAHRGLLAWFATQQGHGWAGGYARPADAQPMLGQIGTKDRFLPVFLLFLVQSSHSMPARTLPQRWTAGGKCPIGVLRPNDSTGLYLAAKGGAAKDSHANMDAGSFILAWRGLRFATDLGNQDYTPLEAALGSALWDKSQHSARWELLTKHNAGHSTLTVNGAPHLTDGRAHLLRNDLPAEAAFGFDLTPLFGEMVDSSLRYFAPIGQDSLLMTDRILPNTRTRTLTWQLLTTAEVTLADRGATLRLGSHRLRLSLLGSLAAELRLVPLCPPPLPYDKAIPGLQRLEIHLTDPPPGQPLLLQVLICGLD